MSVAVACSVKHACKLVAWFVLGTDLVVGAWQKVLEEEEEEEERGKVAVGLLQVLTFPPQANLQQKLIPTRYHDISIQ